MENPTNPQPVGDVAAAAPLRHYGTNASDPKGWQNFVPGFSPEPFEGEVEISTSEQSVPYRAGQTMLTATDRITGVEWDCYYPTPDYPARPTAEVIEREVRLQITRSYYE